MRRRRRKASPRSTYPGVLSNCEQCHVPGSYDFANSASADAVGLTGDGIDKRLPKTVGVGYYVGTVGGTTRTISGATCATLGTSGAQTDVGVFSLSPWIKPLANGAGDAATPNSGNFFGYGFVFNANATTGDSVTCPLNGDPAIVVAPQGTLQASPLSLVTSPTVTVCTGCHDSPLAISHMKVNGGTFYGPRSSLGSGAVPGLPLQWQDGRHQGRPQGGRSKPDVAGVRSGR